MSPAVPAPRWERVFFPARRVQDDGDGEDGSRPPTPQPRLATCGKHTVQGQHRVVTWSPRCSATYTPTSGPTPTSTGPGGVGKTRLPVAVGERLRDDFGAGTVFVPLEAVTDPRLVLAAIGRAAGAGTPGITGRWLSTRTGCCAAPPAGSRAGVFLTYRA
jgi:hypothetical protein